MDVGSNYRPDIDGLRAIAVLSVVLFHIGFDSFSGGFVGVDIFFVISGFLITRIIYSEGLSGNFSFSNFYLRRMRRLFPALFFTLLITFILGFLLFSPEHFERLGGALVYAIMMCANFFFWRESGYFDTDAIFKPLLHIWSLSVEEQFYMVWPLLLILCLRIGARWMLPVVILVLGALSLYLAEVMIDEDASSAFFLVPFRVVEFSVGALIVWGISYQPKNRLFLEAFAIVGLMAVLSAMFMFNEDTRFPGVSSLLPCLGAAILIYAGKENFVGRILSNRLMVGIGLISYSLYLIHWPIIVFYKYWSVAEISLIEQVGMLLGALIAAIGMYFFIEKPFRLSSKKITCWKPLHFNAACVVCSLAILFPATNVWSNNGWKWRVPEDINKSIQAISESGQQRAKLIRASLCHMNTNKQTFEVFSKGLAACHKMNSENYVILGDSHAADLYVALSRAYKETNFLQFTGSSCNGTNLNGKNRCAQLFEYAFKFMKENRTKIDGVILTGRYSVIYNKPKFRAKLNILFSYIESLDDLGLDVVLFGPQQEFHPDLKTLLSSRKNLDNFESFALKYIKDTPFIVDDEIKNYSIENGVNYISKLDIMCREKYCPVFDEQGRILYPDYGHWNEYGADDFGDKIKKIYPKIDEMFCSEDLERC